MKGRGTVLFRPAIGVGGVYGSGYIDSGMRQSTAGLADGSRAAALYKFYFRTF